MLVNQILDKHTYRSDSWRCLSAPEPTCNGLYHTARSSDQRRTDGCPGDKNTLLITRQKPPVLVTLL